ALVVSARREDFRIVHISIQGTHVHLLGEADHRRALSRGMQGFGISAAKQLNAAVTKRRGGERRRGPVFSDPYPPKVISSCVQARNALAYVLNNWRRHREDRELRGREDRYPIDPFSS